MMNKFWIWFIRLMIVLITMASTTFEDFYIRLTLIFVAFALFEVSDYFVKKEDNNDSPPIAGV